MAQAAVSFLLDKLTTFLLEEKRLLAGVREEAEYIRDELEFMKVFLGVTDAIEESDAGLRLMVKKVRDVAYDMEDSLDEFMLCYVHDHRHAFYAWLHKLSQSIKKLRARRRIALKIQRIKYRVINISESHRRYLIRNDIMEQGVSSRRLARPGSRGGGLLLGEIDLVGIEKPKNMLIKWLLGDNADRDVVSVVGMGGLGKSTLVRKVFNDPEVQKHFRFRAWITVSQYFNEEDLLKDMIQQLFRGKPDPKGMDSMNYDNLSTIINRFVQQKKYLIVLDDVWHTSAWNVLQHALPNNSRGSRIFVTTRNIEVASTSCKAFSDIVYPLNPLSPEESWSLFCKKTFRSNSCPPHLINVSETILSRCEGLPLAIVSISGVLATKDQNRIDEWEMVHRSLGAGLESNDKLKGTSKILSLSYNDLPYYLKSLLIYFSIFPQGNPIKCMRLIRLWIAEGFVKEKEGMTSEEVAEDYLNELIKRSLVQVVETTSDGRVKTCRVHDLLREIMITKAKDQDFVAIAKDQRTVWPEKVRRVSIHNAMPTILQGHLSSRLRSLLMFWGVDSRFDSSTLNLSSVQLRLLNVLDLGGAPLKEIPEEVFCLFLLKFLSLKKTKVSFIPSSIGKLLYLETLDLKHSQVTEVPVEILKLQRLRHLLVYRYEFDAGNRVHTKFGFKAPAQMGIGCLQSVQKLCFVEANQGKDLILELGKLIQLRRLGIVKVREGDAKDLCSSIERLVNLRALSINAITENETIDLDYVVSPPKFLQRVYLSGRLQKVPNWVSSLHGLVKLVLKWSKLRDDPLPSLQGLPNLVHLEFVQVYDGLILCFQKNGFQRLKFLGLNKLDGLKAIIVEQGAMPCLEKLVVHGCKSLERVPFGIEHLTELKVLEFFNMPCLEKFVVHGRKSLGRVPFGIEHLTELKVLELTMALHPNGEGEDFLRIAHVPDVYTTYWNNENSDIFCFESSRKDKNLQPSLSVAAIHDRHIWK